MAVARAGLVPLVPGVVWLGAVMRAACVVVVWFRGVWRLVSCGRRVVPGGVRRGRWSACVCF